MLGKNVLYTHDNGVTWRAATVIEVLTSGNVNLFTHPKGNSGNTDYLSNVPATGQTRYEAIV